MSVEYIETRLLEETMVGTGSKKILRADEDGLEDGKLLKSSSTGISSANLSDHLEGTPGQIVVSPVLSTDNVDTGGAKVGFESVPVTNKKLMLVNGAVVETSLPGVNNILRLDSVIQQGASRPSTFYNCGNYSSDGNNQTSVPGEFIVDLTSLVNAKCIIMDVSLLTYTLNAGISTQAKFTLYMNVLSSTTYFFCNPNIVGETANRELDIAFSYQGNNRYLVIGTPTETYGLAGSRAIILNIDKIISSNSSMSLTKASLPITFNGTGTSVIGPGGHTLKQRFKLYPSLTSGLVQANGLPNLEASTSSRTLAWNTSIGSSSAPATLNVYGKSTLRDRLTVPKDGSNSTSGIIDAGDSYYLGGNKWIHNQGGNYCTAVGYSALRDNTTDGYNSAMGYYALSGNETGSDNSAMGSNALRNNTEGSFNSAMGVSALRNNTEGSFNSAMGYHAGRYIANGSTGKTTGNNNLYLGSQTKAKEDGTNNEIVIGANAIGLGSNSMVLGHTTNLLTALRGKVGIGTNAPEHGLHVGTNYNSDGNIKANNNLIAGTDVEAGGDVSAINNVIAENNVYAANDVYAENNVSAKNNVHATNDVTANRDVNAGNNITATETVTGKNLVAVASGSAGGYINAGRDVTANRDVNAGETVTGKKLVATQSITAGTTIDATGNITSGGYVEGNYVRAVLKNGAGGDIIAANNVLGNNIVEAGNDVIASKEVKAGQAINTSYFTSLNNGEYLMDCNHNNLDIPLHLGNEAMICGIITNSRYDLTSEDILLELPLGTNGRLFQVETMLAFRIIVSHSNSNEYILREETININSIISTLNDSNGYKIQKHKVISDLCVGYNITQDIITAWESAYEYEDELDSLLPSNFFTFEKTFLGAAKLKPKATLDENKIARLLYEAGFESYPYNIEYSYKINTNILGTNTIMAWAKK